MNKKYFQRMSFSIAVTFVFVTIMAMVVTKPKETQAVVNRDTVTILEIEPGDAFMLTKTNAKSGSESFNSNGKKIIVDHMTMAEFISKVDQINGKYDVVVLGSYAGSYTAPFNSTVMTKKLPDYIPFGKELSSQKTADKKPQSYNGMLNDSVFLKDNKTYVEYYSENDITNKRAKEILEMINSGQLVYIANEALAVSGSKINSNFNSINNNNLIKISNNNITVDNILNQLNSTTNKPKYRPILTVNSKPADNNRNMNFTFNLTTEDDTPLKVNLYLDLNGDGLFKDKELVKQVDVTPVNGQIVNGTIGYNLQNEFIGLLTWKVEVVTKNNAKVYETNSINYNSVLGKKINVNVLQIYPISQVDNSNKNILDLKADNTIINTLLPNVTDYSLTITSMSSTDFNNNAGKSLLLNGKYDMVILGFADSYGNADLSDNAITELKNFIKTGQSVMFTHDTLTYRILPYNQIDTKDKSSKNTTHAFRDIIGQSRYKDTQYNPSEMDIYQKYNVNTGQYESRQIPHDSSIDPNKITYGFSDGILKMYDSTGSNSSFSTTSNSVHKINDGLLTQYPFLLSDISVADTHHQWYQLNLEDEDVVPWYTLNPNQNNVYNKYDARNYYYIYSKGNITYSGTGHSNNFTTDEEKLFINTMVKASRGANHAPKIEVTNLKEGDSFSKNQSKIEFTVTPSDMDNDKLTTTITVKNANGGIVGQTKQYSTPQGTPIPVSLDSSIYNFATMGASMSVEIETVDPQGAKATQKINVNLANDPTISLSYVSDRTGYLKGDTAAVTLTATANAGDINNNITNIKFTANNPDISKYTLNVTELNYNSVTFNPIINKEQSKTINVTLNGEGNITVPGKLTYDYNGRTVTTDYSIPLAVRTGQINVSIVDENNQLIRGGNISVTAPSNNIPNAINFNGIVQSFTNLTSGSYSFNLPQFTVDGVKYKVIGQETQNYQLGYENSVCDVKFTVTNTQAPSLSLSYTKTDGFLKGDVGNVTINLNGTQGDSAGTITNIKLKLTNTDASNLTLDNDTFVFSDMSINSASSGNPQSQSFNVNFLQEGCFTVQGKLTYTLTVGNISRPIELDYPLTFDVRTGVIPVSINVSDSYTNTSALDVPVTVTLKDKDGKILSTKILDVATTSYSFDNLKSDSYKVEADCPKGFTLDYNSKTVNINYTSNSGPVTFNYTKEVPTLVHGIYENGKIKPLNYNLTKETYAILGMEVKTHGTANLQLDLDSNINSIPISNFNIYEVNDLGNVIGTLDTSKNILQNDHSYNIILGDELDKHYIITYKVKFGSNNSYTNNAKLTGIATAPVIVNCEDLPDLF